MTYLYETIPSRPGDEVRRFEIKQSIHEMALTRHPETGEPVRRVITGGLGLTRAKSFHHAGPASSHTHSSGCGCGPRGCG